MKPNINVLKKKSRATINALKNCTEIGNVISQNYLNKAPHTFDFSKKNRILSRVDLKNKKKFTQYINQTISTARRKFGAGGYGENRIIYRRSNMFDNEAEPRSVHLAVDIWLPAGTAVFSPLPAVIHSFRDNNNFGDYGPTIILKHKLDDVIFYTLYGHLSRSSLKKLKVGMKIKQGQKITKVGKYEENGNWPPHLHLQIITDMLGKRGDFPGVAKPSEKKYYLALCPDPNLILHLNPPHSALLRSS